MILESLAIAAASVTIGKTAFFAPVRKHAPTRFLRKLLNCPYCLAHWLAVIVTIMQPWTGLFDCVINTCALVALSSLAAIFLAEYLGILEKE